MIQHEKIKVLHNYLESDITTKMLGHKYDTDHKAEIFTLRIEDSTVFVTVLDEFFEDNKVGEIKKKLQNFRLKEFIRHTWSKRIMVTKFGLKLEDF